MSEDQLYAILYVSSSTRKMSDGELSSLYVTASRKNLESGVTGVLLHSNGNFIQYIEGPQKGLLDIYHRIKQDNRHTGLIEIMNEPIAAREFPQWSLASKTEFFQTFSDPEHYSNLLQPDSDGLGLQNSVVRSVLHSFWNQSGN